MSRIPTRLAGPAPVDSTVETVYTVPADRRTILRYIHVQNPGASATFTLSVGTDAAGTRVYDAVSIATGVPFEKWVYIPLEAGEIIQLDSSADDQLVATLGGDEIVLA